MRGLGCNTAHGHGPVLHCIAGEAGCRRLLRRHGHTGDGQCGSTQAWAGITLQVDMLVCFLCVCTASHGCNAGDAEPQRAAAPPQPALQAWALACPSAACMPATLAATCAWLTCQGESFGCGVAMAPESSLVSITWSWAATFAPTCAWLTCGGKQQAFSCPRLVVKRATSNLVASCRPVFVPIQSSFFS